MATYHPYAVGYKVYLRALERADLAGNMLQWTNDARVTHFMYMGTFPNTLEALEYEFDLLMNAKTGGLLQAPNFPTNVVFAVVEKASDLHIGNVGLFGINWVMRVAEFRAIIGEPKYWGGGYSLEAYRLAIEYGFDRLNLRRFVAGTRADHVASSFTLKQIGFVKEGRLRKHFLRGEQAYDILQFGLLRDEYLKKFPAAVAVGMEAEKN